MIATVVQGYGVPSCCVEIREAAKHPTTHGTAPYRTYLALNADSAEAEKLRVKQQVPISLCSLVRDLRRER